MTTALPYQGTGPRYEFNGLDIVLRTVVVTGHSISGSKSVAGRTLLRKSPVAQQSMHFNTYRTTRCRAK
ncbi:protein of unknown function [uncultured Woeseiaceae bacterium]|uniref:Uncharacterized protein n=1 Tax=uncultured Woeseiaceae bacterium TaxID=1983305 RepID=A0A7D9H3U9_9GAMM|nr:protein of unknown function [uncultured Woeseiaceae bacterium]